MTILDTLAFILGYAIIISSSLCVTIFCTVVIWYWAISKYYDTKTLVKFVINNTEIMNQFENDKEYVEFRKEWVKKTPLRMKE